MENDNKVALLEDEVKILKNEVQSVLLDLRDVYLNNENPFNNKMGNFSTQATVQVSTNNDQGHNDQSKKKDEEQKKPEASDTEELKDSVDSSPDENSDDEISEEKDMGKPINNLNGKSAQKVFSQIEETSQKAFEQSRKTDLETILKLSDWVDETVKRLGSEKTKDILEISTLMGHIAPELKKILIRMAVSNSYTVQSEITPRDYLETLC
ncbi:MAG: hypothetical protein NTV30_10680 [Chloroflexi bacterium]|nr:hypothetical protein [Chloroflexota bacterium]